MIMNYKAKNCKKVYCKEDYFNFVHDRFYHKYEEYSIDPSLSNHNVFVYQGEHRKGIGLWFNKNVFHRIFTEDKNFMRKHKLKRILNDE